MWKILGDLQGGKDALVETDSNHVVMYKSHKKIENRKGKLYTILPVFTTKVSTAQWSDLHTLMN